MSYVLRNAVAEDALYITDVCGKDMCSLLGRAKWYDQSKVDGVVSQLIYGGHISVVEEDGVIVGAMGAVPTPWLWNPDVLLLAEVFWWVREDRRASRIGHMLLTAFEERGKALGVAEVVMSTMPSTTVSLQKRGYQITEYSMTKEM